MESQQTSNNLSVVPVSIHGVGNLGMEPLQQQQQQQQQQQPSHNMDHSMHSLQGNACLPHNLMDTHGHHHAQQLNLGHQHGGHPNAHVPTPPSSHMHHTIQHHGHTAQQFLPYGFANNMGNTGVPSGHQMNPYHPYPQITNQQPVHAMNPMGMNPLQQSCFLQHSACMHFPQNPQPNPLAAALNTQRQSSAVNWMTPSSTGPMGNNQNTLVPTNHNSQNTGLGTIAPPMQNGNNANKLISQALSKPPLPQPPDPNAVPGGLEVLWRELPMDYQKLMVPQDIPDTARFRGYFTVCELLILKRTLEARYHGTMRALPSITSSAPPTMGLNMASSSSGNSGNPTPKPEGHSRRGTKRGSANKERNSNKMARTQENSNGVSAKESDDNHQHQQEQQQQHHHRNNGIGGNCEARSMPENHDDNSLGELMISLDSMKHEINTDMPSPSVGVGGAVKEAMDALSTTNSSTDQNINEVSPNSCGIRDLKVGEDVMILPDKDSDSELTISKTEGSNQGNRLAAVVVTQGGESEEQPSSSNVLENVNNHQKESSNNDMTIQVLPSMPGFSSIFADKKGTNGDHSGAVSTSVCSSTSSCVTMSCEADSKTDESHKQLQLALSTITNTGNSIMTGFTSGIPMSFEGRFNGPPPPYRTANLVIKLLQIGHYQIRSFSNSNPNRLRVLFNTQRMTYECQLPVVPPPSPGIGMSRKVLTVDIGFDQISMLKFGVNNLWMRVEGAPLLTISVNSVQDEAPNQNLSTDDQFLLEQIEKGQIKLSPVHQLFFLNERLVQSLESQFREHPRFRHMIMSQH